MSSYSINTFIYIIEFLDLFFLSLSFLLYSLSMRRRASPHTETPLQPCPYFSISCNSPNFYLLVSSTLSKSFKT